MPHKDQEKKVKQLAVEDPQSPQSKDAKPRMLTAVFT